MKISELEKVVKQVGLEMEVMNDSPRVIARIWWPHTKHGIKLDGKIYRSYTLIEDDVIRINAAYSEVMDFCTFDANLQIEEIFYNEYNCISSINVTIRNDKNRLLSRDEKKTDFEMDSTAYSVNKPKDIDMLAGYTAYNLFNEPLKKHEKENIMRGISSLLKLNLYNIYGTVRILVNLARYSRLVEPIEIILNESQIDSTFMIEHILNDAWVFYQDQIAAKKLFRVLSKYKSTAKISLALGRGFLPDVIVESPRIMKQVCENWEFVTDTASKILTMIIQNEQKNAIRIFLNNYPPFITDDFWYITEPFLVFIHDKKTVKNFLDNWIDLNDQSTDFIDDLETLSVRMWTDDFRLVIEKLYDLTPKNHLFQKIVDALKAGNAFSEMEIAKVLDMFIDDPEVDLTYGNAYIVKVFYKDEEIREKLYSIDKIIETLIATDQMALLPDVLKEVFLF